MLEFVRALGIAEEIAADDGERGVVAPLVGIADLLGERGELGERLLLRLDRHPVEIVDVLAQRAFEVPDQLQHAALAVGAERGVDVELTERLAEVVVRVLHAALPARQQRLAAGEHAAVEIEVLVDERRGQERRRDVNHVPAHVGLEIGEAVRGDHRVDALEELGLGDVDGRKLRRAGRGEERLPLERLGQREQLRARHAVIDLVRIAARHQIEGVLGERGLDRHHRLGVGRGLRRGIAGEHEHLADVFDVLLALLDEVLFRLEVVVAIGQAEPALIGDGDHRRRFLEILLGAEREEHIDAEPLQRADLRGQRRSCRRPPRCARGRRPAASRRALRRTFRRCRWRRSRRASAARRCDRPSPSDILSSRPRSVSRLRSTSSLKRPHDA